MRNLLPSCFIYKLQEDFPFWGQSNEMFLGFTSGRL
jgi:hypothetical protein